jgi:hypothetical protein
MRRAPLAVSVAVAVVAFAVGVAVWCAVVWLAR